MRAGGFVPGRPPTPAAVRLLCDHQQRRHLRVNAGPGEGGVADVRLSLNNDPDNFAICETDVWMHLRLTSVFPPLSPHWNVPGGVVAAAVVAARPILRLFSGASYRWVT
jgi:hypothetical protein